MTTQHSSAVNNPDLEKIVKRWAVEMFEVTKTEEQSFISPEHLVYNINLKGIQSTNKEPTTDVSHGGYCNVNVHQSSTFNNTKVSVRNARDNTTHHPAAVNVDLTVNFQT
ncbi:hypothetical protein HELRODRAFT_190216 [Helobdella robusta]|uniref:Uncharacterized protein n=1 Tax=Helobdella robusta TaxID=6412 RepID=T1FRS1_HELRO|nr:hypothetical protein HELRODRAFT_190216 [Helobdella robusta]ESO10882.1 hypothetical protein HELRODRAFT_190216 [Helobdella robusta]